MPRRSLYDCSKAKLKDRRIFCSAGHRLSARSEDGSISAKRLEKGEPLTFKVCQVCTDFESMGIEKVRPRERGWERK